MDQQRFLQQLQIVLNPAQGDVKGATSVLQREFYKQPESLIFLIEIATANEDLNLKQLAAVEARTLVSKHWTSVQADKGQIRERLLRSTLAESSSLVRHSIARIISAIAKIDLADGEWLSLPDMLIQAAGSGNKNEREVGTYVLFTILETLDEGLDAKFQDLFGLFSKTIRDPESQEVRINTILCLSKLAMSLDSDENITPVKAFQDTVPPMVEVLKSVIDQKEEDRIMQCFEVFHTLLGCDPQLLTVHLKDLVLFMNELAANTNVDEETRTQAVSFLMQAVQYRKLKIQSMRLGEQLTLTALQLVTELGDLISADDDEITPARSALGLLDVLSQSLPPGQTVVPLLNALGQYFHSGDANYRRAGIMALGMCVEGAPDFISTQMKQIFPVVFQLLADPEPSVRQATLHTVARLADDLPEDLSAEHERLMPLLFQNLASAMQEYKGEEDGPVVDIMKAGISAIDAVVDGLEEKDVVPYQDELVPILHKLFKHPDFRIKGLSAGALGSLASSSGDAFLPFFDDSMHLLQEFATAKDSEQELDLRASVTDAMGEMAAAAGPERYQPYVQPLMQATEEALHLGHSRCKESTYLFWGSMSKVYAEHFSPFLDGVVKGLFACIEQEETELEVSLGDAARDLAGQEVNIAGKKVKVAGPDEIDDDADVEDVDLEEDDDLWDDITATTPLSLEKEIAVDVLGDLVTHTKSSYLPYFEKTIEMIMPLVEHPYEGVRKSTISTMHRSYAMLFTIAEESGQMPKWKAGLPLQIKTPEEIKKFGEILMTTTVKMWMEEDDRATVCDINRNMAENLRYCGPSLIANETVLHNVIQMVTDIITKKHPCQLEFGEDDLLDSGGEVSEFDWVVVDTALDVVSGMAVALGGSFAELWKVFEKTILRYAGSSEGLERATAVGVIAECINGMGSAVTPFTPTLLKLLLHRLSDEDPQTKSNAAYAVGRLVEHSNSATEITKEFPKILTRLETCLQMNVSRLQDNATGCLSRMILKHRNSVPIKQVLPALVNILPLKNDYEENDPLYRMICQLYKWDDPNIRELTPQFIPIFQAVLAKDDQLEDERRSEVIELVKWLNSVQPGVAPWADQL